jgi:nitrate reductase gamma subunit
VGILLAVITYFAYTFIIVMYTVKIVKFLKCPLHVRWDLYPVLTEENYRYGGSYFENREWWTKTRTKASFRGFIHLLKDNFYLGAYFLRNRSYWLALYPWHLGFILIISFHIFCFLGAATTLLGFDISRTSTSPGGILVYYVILVTGIASFILGAIGSVGLLIKRSTSDELKFYASPLNFFNYVFFLIVFLSGLFSWYFSDSTFSEYREFWRDLITVRAPHIHWPTAVHILLFSLFLIYLPYTRSMHYISRFLAAFFIRWDDEPNLAGSAIEGKIRKQLEGTVSWSASHIQTGKTWAQVAQEVQHPGPKEIRG